MRGGSVSHTVHSTGGHVQASATVLTQAHYTRAPEQADEGDADTLVTRIEHLAKQELLGQQIDQCSVEQHACRHGV